LASGRASPEKTLPIADPQESYNACREEPAMKFDIKALALAWAILWGGAVLIVALVNLAWAGYGHNFLEMLSSWYPGYTAARSIIEVIVVTAYAIADGLIGGAIFGWLYNCLAKAGELKPGLVTK
jgi:hypothetical protein